MSFQPTTTATPQDIHTSSSGNFHHRPNEANRPDRTEAEMNTETPRSLSSNVSEYGSSSNNLSPDTSHITADRNAFFEAKEEDTDTKLSPAERAKKLEKEMGHTDFERRRSSLGNADKMLNIGKSKDFKVE
jgi:hypothetical protein